MNLLISYLLQVIGTSAILYGYYHIALRNKQFHRYNRFYLLAATAISLIIPFFNIPVYFTRAETDSSFVLQTLTVISSGDPETITAPVPIDTHTNWFTVQNFLYFFYILVALLILLRIIFSLARIRRIIKTNQVEQLDKIRFVNTAEPGTPFSFFRWLFWNKNISLHSEKGEQIFRHELFHIEQKHSWDIIFMELLTVILWINPFFHLIKKEIKAIHEFLADQFAVKENKKWEYAELLLMQAFHTNQHLVNPFFHNQIKRRIAMITTSQKPSYRYLRKIMVLPLAVIAAALFAFSYKYKKDTAKTNSLEKPITVIIDAGHGGTDIGVTSADGTLEKDIVLAIAQKVKSLNEDRNINIILTRTEDVFPTLKSRTDLANKNDPALFISIHVNAAPNSTNQKKTGFEIYVPKKNKTFYSENKILGSILLNYFSQLYPVDKSIKQAESNIWVLENANCPSALIECGYMNNAKDLAFIKDPANQDKIAGSILQTIDQFIMQKKSDDWEERKLTVSGTVNGLQKMAQSTAGGHTTGYFEVIGSNDAVSFVADSIVFITAPENTKTVVKTALYIVNGEKQNADFFFGKQITAERILIYPTDNEYAIKKYGEGAKKGVIVFENAKTEALILPINSTDTTKPVTVDNITFDKVETEASFPGGSLKWQQYLERNLNALIPAKNKTSDGAYTVVIQFIVNKEGDISEIKALTKHGHGMEEEAIRVIKNGPKWKPAIQNGHIVRSFKKQPITFIVGKGEKNFPGNTKVTGKELNEVVVVGFPIEKEIPVTTNGKELKEVVVEGVPIVKEIPANKAIGRELNEVVVEGYPIVKEIGSPVTIQNETNIHTSDNRVIALDPLALYIGVDNLITVSSSKVKKEDLVVTASEGTITGKNGKYYIKGLHTVGDAIFKISTKNGKELSSIKFNVRTIPELSSSSVKPSSNVPKITVAELKNATPHQLLQLATGTEIVSYVFTIDTDKGDIIEIRITGSEWNAATKVQLNNATEGKLITFDAIKVKVNGVEKKVPSKVYEVVN